MRPILSRCSCCFPSFHAVGALALWHCLSSSFTAFRGPAVCDSTFHRLSPRLCCLFRRPLLDNTAGAAGKTAMKGGLSCQKQCLSSLRHRLSLPCCRRPRTRMPASLSAGCTTARWSWSAVKRPWRPHDSCDSVCSPIDSQPCRIARGLGCSQARRGWSARAR